MAGISRRRYLHAGGLLLCLPAVGCAGLDPRTNCGGFRRDTTVASISEGKVGEQLTLAGKLVDDQPGEESVLIDDGTGIVEAFPARGPQGEYMASRPTGDCQSFSGEVDRLPDTGRVDVVMVLAGHETQE